MKKPKEFAFRSGERIPPEGAAVHVGRLVYRGTTHGEAIEKAVADHPDGWEDFDKHGERKYIRGFVTDTKRFVKRKEANQIAKNSDQLRRKSTNLLHSANLQEDWELD